ncbi:MAG TPA: methylmalonyl-CoA epimerase [Acidobacteriota bacterium]|nr:methylmalonyl-CoA epimerase [Acidobacteriota bacterium]
MTLDAIAVGPLDHVAIAVHDLEAAALRLGKPFGVELSYREEIVASEVEVGFLEVPGQTNIELVCPMTDDSPLARFLGKRGEALHHICFRVDDVVAALAAAKRAGLDLIDQKPRPGARDSLIAFLHPRSVGGLLVELKQKAE